MSIPKNSPKASHAIWNLSEGSTDFTILCNSTPLLKNRSQLSFIHLLAIFYRSHMHPARVLIVAQCFRRCQWSLTLCLLAYFESTATLVLRRTLTLTKIEVTCLPHRVAFREEAISLLLDKAREKESTQDGCGDDVNASLANCHRLFCSSFTCSNSLPYCYVLDIIHEVPCYSP